MGEGAAGRTRGREGSAQGLEAPTLGEESWAAAGEGCSGRAGAAGRGDARSPAVPRPGPPDGWLLLGADSARRGARGTGRRLSGPGVAIPASHGRRRRLGSAASLGLRDSAGGAGSGWGRGRGRAPPGLGLGLGAPGWLRPRATRPGLRTWRSARSEGEHLGSRRAAHPHTDPGAPCHRQPPTRTRTDTGGHRHTVGDIHTDLGTLCHTATHADTNKRLARVQTHILTDLGTLHQTPSTADTDIHRHSHQDT